MIGGNWLSGIFMSRFILQRQLTCVDLHVAHTSKGLTEEPSGKSDSGTVKQRKMSKKNTEEEPKARALMSTNSDR